LIYLGLIKVSSEDKSIKWTIEDFDKINEKEYMEERRRLCDIQFKKEPPRAVTQAFEVSALLKL